MKLATSISVLASLAALPIARADDPPAPPDSVKPFLSADEASAYLGTFSGAFGPPGQTLVVTYGDDQLHGFALIPSAKAAHGYQRVALPKLSGADDVIPSLGVHQALVANLDKQAGDELVLQYTVLHQAKLPAYVVLHWNGRAFVRSSALEHKLDRAIDANGEKVLSDDQLRAALGVAKAKP
ncbi:MAG TPA: hypothetical protein VLX92_18085 [Kofleriaceae bacterium]|nr:hypothetical protein [Kofleriaceae bacterium]